MTSDFLTYFIIFIIILHFIVGFGYLIYKLSPRKEDKENHEMEDPLNSGE